MKSKLIAFSLSALMLFSTGCASKNSVVSKDVKNLMTDIKAEAVDSSYKIENKDAKNLMDFSLKMFKSTFKDENTLISPLSIIGALGMTSNGSAKKTKAEFEKTFGVNDVEKINKFFHSYAKSLPSEEKYKFNIANSIWINDTSGLTPNTDFLQTNANYYNAEMYESSFNKKTETDINNWVEKNTDGMIDKIIDEINENSIMYLINALSFDAEWEKIYTEDQINKREFFNENKESEEVEFMFSKEYQYLSGNNYTGFIKNYKDGKYAFAAILPSEGVSMKSFIENLNYEDLYNALSEPEGTLVYANLPKFSYAFGTSLVSPLKSMGLNAAFDENLADFSGMGKLANGNLYIGNVMHKTFIEVNEKGTKAGAVTSVEMEATSMPAEPKIVDLNRPFIYLIIDKEYNLPIFVGALMEIK